MTPADRYLELLKGCLTRNLFLDEQREEVHLVGKHVLLWKAFMQVEKGRDWRIVKPTPVDATSREEGRDWPQNGETMLGKARLDNIQDCVTSVLEDDVPGDLIEAGVWRGGAAILMRAVLEAHGVRDRSVWVADSFEGLPPPDADRYPQDAGLDYSAVPVLQVGVEQVRANFAKYDLLDDQVKFLPGWFKDTLDTAPIEQLSVIRLDGDLYESTIDSIAALYPKLAIGGYLIVDDYNAPNWDRAAGQAIRDYRDQHGITEPIREIDWTAICWRRER
jgi:O-methyltransferase